MANAFFVRCDCRNRRFTGGKSRFLQEADGRKGIASAADELCGIALRSKALERECSIKKHGDDQCDEGKTCAYDPNFLSSAVDLRQYRIEKAKRSQI